MTDHKLGMSQRAISDMSEDKTDEATEKAIANIRKRSGVDEGEDVVDLLMSAPTPEIKGMLLLILALIEKKGAYKALKAWRTDFNFEWGTGRKGEYRRYYMRHRIEIGERRKKGKKEPENRRPR